MRVRTIFKGRLRTFLAWHLNLTGFTYTMVIFAGLVLAILDELQSAVVMLAAGLLTVLPWKLSVQARSRATLSARQNRLNHQLADLESKAEANALQARTDSLAALDSARSEWGMLLRAERAHFASQLREHSTEK